MGISRNLIGQKFGYLTVIEKTDKKKDNGIVWLCKCECGGLKEVTTANLKAGRVTSCGCKVHEPKFENLSGQKFGRLTVTKPTGEKTKNRSVIWECLCDCGKVTRVSTESLKRSNGTKSCGCLQKEVAKRNGEALIKDLSGQKFGKLTVLNKSKNETSYGKILWVCRCECGNIIEVTRDHLKDGHTSSCGCLGKSKGEFLIEQILMKNNISFKKQKTFDTCIFPKTNYHLYFDFFVNNTYLIEFDGEQHFSPKRFNNCSLQEAEEQFNKTKERDLFKNKWCLQNKIPLIRIKYTQINNITLQDLLIETTNFLIKEENYGMD